MSTANTPSETALYTLGQPFEGKAQHRPPGNQYNFRHGFHTLAVFMHNPAPHEIHAFQNDPITIGFRQNGPILWAIFKAGDAYHGDAPYTPHKVEPEGRIFPELPSPNSRYPITIILAEESEGIIVSLRVATMSPGMSRYVREQTKKLLDQPFSEEEFQQSIQEVYLLHPHSAGMLRLPELVETLGTP